MVETNQFKLPLVEAAQAQKHVTVNEALARLDAAAQLRLLSVTQTVPPVNVADGVAYGVPVGAVNDWDLHAGEVAIFANGGWVFLPPAVGWRAWIVDKATSAIHDGLDWREGLLSLSATGAATTWAIEEFDHVITPGFYNHTSVIIDDNVQVTGVTGRVLSDITGAGLVSWRLGIDGVSTRFASDLGLTANTAFAGLSGKPQTYWGGEPIRLSSDGGDFASGIVRLAIHSIRLDPPRSV